MMRRAAFTVCALASLTAGGWLVWSRLGPMRMVAACAVLLVVAVAVGTHLEAVSGDQADDGTDRILGNEPTYLVFDETHDGTWEGA